MLTACAIAGAVVVFVAQVAPARTAATYTVSISGGGAQPEGTENHLVHLHGVDLARR